MKRLLLLALLVVGSASARTPRHQNNRVEDFNFELSLGQHVALNRFNATSYAADALPGGSLTELRGAVRLYFAKPVLGGYVDAGIGIMPAPRSSNLDGVPMPSAGVSYVLRGITDQNGPTGVTGHLRLGLGLFGRIGLGPKTHLIPSFGVGFMTFQARGMEASFKQAGANQQYTGQFGWGAGWSGYREWRELGYLTARLQWVYCMRPRLGFSVGAEYTWSFDRMSFYGSYQSDYLSNSRAWYLRGNRLSMLGVSVGLVFM